ncbi:enoyl-CoA hydratase/isomerase family protein [Paracoccus suum]|uniref:Enoyl-CoA hydratase/isomerase family protein n=1 Tax=Paracoccus suum TaxID=2259340 RepID=A0A344PNJ3_9RHOB|nr:enoyl-CoA hydratase-related protein [Paracoccus suum]AXC50948.1 enoyl-CoA hydratase/isomerase family protein [Paracoccus suum]
MSEPVLFETSGPVAIITINRPDRMNALGLAVREGLWDAFHRFEDDSDLQVAILTATGTRAFCAGLDLKEASETGLQALPKGRGGLPVIGNPMHITKPTIAAVNGVAMAGGWLMAQMCDLCVAADHARFAVTEVKVGRGVPWAVPLIHMLPQRIAMELLLTGEAMSAQRLAEIGYLNRVVPAADLMDAAMTLASTIAANAPLSVRAARAVMHLAGEHGRTEALAAADAVFAPVYASLDALEGPRAFAEKRAPKWLGR